MHTIDVVPGQEPLYRRLVHRSALFSLAVGPLIGGLPFLVIHPLTILFAYLFGAVPALLGGVLYGWIVARTAMRFRYMWIQRLLLGAACGAVGTLLFSLAFQSWDKLFVLTMFGSPAGAVCALIYRRAWIDRDLFEPVRAVMTTKLEEPV